MGKHFFIKSLWKLGMFLLVLALILFIIVGRFKLETPFFAQETLDCCEIAIEPVDGGTVSGRIVEVNNHDLCEVDNPKIFRVYFEAENGNICEEEIGLSLQAVVQGAPLPFSGPVSPSSTTCDEEENVIQSDFFLEFDGGDSVVDLFIQAKADFGGSSTGWVTGLPWSYNGQGPNLVEDPNFITITGVQTLNVNWDITGVTSDIGVGAVRILSRLEMGNVLMSNEDYGPIFYEGEEIEGIDETLNEENMWYEVWLDELVDEEDYPVNHEVDIGINQDGFLHFKIEVVDEACNYASQQGKIQLGSPWIATRGGLVYSGGDINLAIKQSFYGDIISLDFQEYPKYPYISEDELTSITSELIAASGVYGFASLGFISEEKKYPYDLDEYEKSVNHSWYEALLSLANSRDPERQIWRIVEDAEDEDFNLRICRTNQFVYFVENDLQIDPMFYENLALNDLGGCIFVVKGDINISGGSFKSQPNFIRYDILRGFFVADGVIDIEFADEEGIRDGLKVVGGLFATGGESGEPSIKLGRSLQLRDNLQYPSLILFYDARYMDTAKKVFGDTLGGVYVRDIGLKE